MSEVNLKVSDPLLKVSDAFLGSIQADLGTALSWPNKPDQGKTHTLAEELTALRSLKDELYMALKAVVGLIESGQLVRDVSGDEEPDWALKTLGLVRIVAQARYAVEKAKQ
jgi:hypothetical protein